MKRERNGIIIKILVLTFVAIMATGVAFAWFSTTFETDNGVKFNSSEGEFVNMYAWMFNLTDEASGEATDKSGTWVAATGTNPITIDDEDDDQPGYLINAVAEYSYSLTEDNAINLDKTYYTRSGSSPNYVYTKVESPTAGNLGSYYEREKSEKYQFASLHLGNVDNLLTLSHDNYFYLRFDITNPVIQGKLALASYSITDEEFEFYDSEGINQTSVVYGRANEAGKSSLFSDMVLVECAVSDTAYTPNDDALDALFVKNYVIKNGEHYLGYNVVNSAPTLADKSSLSDAIIWTFDNNKLTFVYNDATYYLTSDNSTLSLTTTAPNIVWSNSNNKFSYVNNENTYYVTYNSSWGVSTESNDTTGTYDNYVVLVNGDPLESIFEDPKDTGYYLYIRISPDLLRCTEATDYFGEFMPCEILFDMTLEIEFRFYEGE